MGGQLQSQAAKNAAAQFGQQAQFNPYGVSTGLGNTSFANGQATFNPSAGTQNMQNNLAGLTNSSAQNLQQGSGAIANQYYNQLQAQDRDANNKMFQSNLDSQFGNGILGSTAGQYQTQGALSAINQKSLADQVAAQQFGQNYQTQQLNQLTAGLNGNNQINQQQLSQLGLGGTLGSDRSSANYNAFQPNLAAQSNSNAGNFFAGLGNGQQTAANQQNQLNLLQQLLQQGHG